MEALKRPMDLDIGYYEKPKVAAIDPCKLCAHGEFKHVDTRCQKCELRGKRFFEIKHAVA